MATPVFEGAKVADIERLLADANIFFDYRTTEKITTCL